MKRHWHQPMASMCVHICSLSPSPSPLPLFLSLSLSSPLLFFSPFILSWSFRYQSLVLIPSVAKDDIELPTLPPPGMMVEYQHTCWFGASVGEQGFTHARQALSQWSHLSSGHLLPLLPREAGDP